MKTILSLFDYSGSWSKPYKDYGYNVITIDIKRGEDIFELLPLAIEDHLEGNSVYGLLADPPCTDFASSGARHFKAKEIQPSSYNNPRTLQFNNTIEHSIFMVLSVLFLVELLRPVFWAMENPVGTLNTHIPELKKYGPWYFQPCDFGDPYTKKTGLWGVFNKPSGQMALNLFGSEMWSKYGGKSDRTKELRSITPGGFSKAFFEANK